MRRPYCCEESKNEIEKYYINQSGSGLSVFQGYRNQRGHGIGSILSGFFRSALPMIKRGLSSFGRQALKTGLKIAGDVADGTSMREAAEARAREGIKRLAHDGVEYLESDQQRSGISRKRARITYRLEQNIDK